MDHSYMFYKIKDKTPNTQKETENLVYFLNKGFEVIETFEYEDERYFILVKHEHDEEEQSTREIN